MEVKIIRRQLLSLSLILLLLLSLFPGISRSQESDAEENIYIVGDIPAIKVGTDTNITLKFMDFAGFNYTELVKKHKWLVVHLWWPILFGYLMGGGKKGLEEFKKYVCLHTVEFHAYIEGNLSGWHAVVEPSVISGTTSENKADLTLKVRIDGPTSYPMANVVIKVVRKGANGEVLGVSYHKISVKAEHIYLLDIKPFKSVTEVPPGETATIPVEITNLGNYVETYLISAEGDGVVGLFGGQLITINPRETVKMNLQVHTPFGIFDAGTPRSVQIKAYPITSPENVFTASVGIITKGVSPLSIPIFVLIAVVVLTILLLLNVIFRKKMVKGFEIKYFSKKSGSREVKLEKRGSKKIESEKEGKKRQSSVEKYETEDLKKLLTKIKKEETKQRRKFEKSR